MISAQKTQSMREGGALLRQVLGTVAHNVAEGNTGLELDFLAEAEILKLGGTPAFKSYNGFPNSLCVSINDEVVHGIPSAYKFRIDDIVSLDLGVAYNGYFTDSATSVIVTEQGCELVDQIMKLSILTKNQELLKVTYECLLRALAVVRDGAHVGDIGHAVQHHAEAHHFGVVRQLVGHGVGEQIHQDPSIPNYGTPHQGPVLHEGQTIAIEPMLTAGKWNIVTDADGWTVRTADGSLAAHFEHTVLVTKTGHQILT